MDSEARQSPGAADDDLERLSRALRGQVECAKARISERYAKLIEQRSFEPKERKA